ncbi:hypothetical protein GGQ84_001799 [Desulfitispora alkaliphila]|uniref:DUF116 domain-containing protein n=1 Tax=Desulfitispora alkaliphila TaxID=622674 RepID=UPI003D1B23F5
MEVESYTRKRIFIGLIGLSLLFLLGMIVALWLVITNKLPALQTFFLVAVGGISAIFILVVGLGLFFLVWSLWHGKSFPKLQSLMQTSTEWLFPIALRLGVLMGIDEDKIKSSFIKVNNQLVEANKISVEANQILILAPHCLQNSQCPHKITMDVDNCKRCGKCTVDDLINIANKYGAKFVVATGGTFARKFIKEYRPRAIVAIACERDLTSGIQDTNKLPVIGVLNDRPEGPCLNTLVDAKNVEKAIQNLVH